MPVRNEMPQSARPSFDRLDELDAWLLETPTTEVIEELAHLAPEDRVVAFRLLPRDKALEVFESLDPFHQTEILQGLRDERFRQVLEDLDPDDRARLFTELPAMVAKRALAGLSAAERAYTAALLGYPHESAGRVMTPEFVSLRSTMTAGQALDKIRSSDAEEETLFVLPVTDGERQLLGSVDLPALLRAEASEPVVSLMGDTPSVTVLEDQEVAARQIADANLAALPVVDSEGRLVGMITVDDAVRILQEEVSEDVARGGGAEPLRRPYFSVSPFRLATTRASWLLILVLGATLTVNVLGAFEATLAEQVTLALFIPLLIGTGGNTGAQATTVVIRAMSLNQLRFQDLPRVVRREARVGLMLGGMLALVGFGPAAFFFGTEMATVVCLTIVAICTWATFAGSMLPLVASRVGVDPAVVSAPFITTLVDATGLIIYFVIARIVLGV
jgi:magnesium transporter